MATRLEWQLQGIKGSRRPGESIITQPLPWTVHHPNPKFLWEFYVRFVSNKVPLRIPWLHSVAKPGDTSITY